MHWNLVENNIINTTFGLLLISLLTFWLNLAFPKLKKIGYLGTICIILTNLCLFTLLLCRWIIYQYFPLSNIYESLLFLTWCLTCTNLIIQINYSNILISCINTPICLFLIAFASFYLPTNLQKASPLVPALRSNWLMMHVTIMMVSYAILIIGSLLSILFLILEQNQSSKKQLMNAQDFSIKHNKQIYSAYKYNNNSIILKNTSAITLLDNLDNLSYRIIGLGFPLLTIGIIAGAVWANEAWGTYWSWDPKETWALITWLVFASYLHSRLNKSWKGKKPALLAAVGFFVVWICYLGVNFLGKGLHSYGWL